jgi:hypothetical protein
LAGGDRGQRLPRTQATTALLEPGHMLIQHRGPGQARPGQVRSGPVRSSSVTAATPADGVSDLSGLPRRTRRRAARRALDRCDRPTRTLTAQVPFCLTGCDFRRSHPHRLEGTAYARTTRGAHNRPRARARPAAGRTATVRASMSRQSAPLGNVTDTHKPYQR